ncbi:uncharacterized protein CYBJADRAFT_174214 [Cyberlindnera jadinii NRRL Y-1542]|uniref:Uncharacterized protein n=1 Tax=Cyberlindnera jadinii (strain ATCC 18201 / CBS 1600 / BCRC 20928 / JCM 3617 / NBRC 0987 / NRRL Y-1542) TaxID=983966 RepID=A0A1E4RZ17_CYBJN|nr:hypothetical protein CYBJADRAFT_174214 [Cyberlindnera jadinii NRRL Y-1542]ODV72355.1 hypothetical protein CYBJADRAFT_174214 [Cyberlindnera jadinii NRRL Y-1542]
MGLLSKEEMRTEGARGAGSHKVWQLKRFPRANEGFVDESVETAQLHGELSVSSTTMVQQVISQQTQPQEYMFVDMSPKKDSKKASKRQGLSRLFRLSSDKNTQVQTVPHVDTSTRHVPVQGKPGLLRTQSCDLNGPLSPMKRPLTPLVMTVSSDGRAVLQHSSSASSSQTDLFSLSHRSPSPKRDVESLYSSENELEEEEDATRAFGRAVSRRKRANTATSISSVNGGMARGQLSRNQSITSLSSIQRARTTPIKTHSSITTPTSMRQSTPVESRPTMDFMGSFFDDTSRTPSRRPLHQRQQKSISVLGPPLGMDDYGNDDTSTIFGPDLVASSPNTITNQHNSRNNANNTNDSANTSTHNINTAIYNDFDEFFDFKAFSEEHT